MEKSGKISLQKQKKREFVDSLAKELSAAASIYLLDFQKITVAQDNALRLNLRKKGISYRAAKNRLIREALKKANITGLDSYLKGATSIMLGGVEDPMLPAREVVEFHKANPDILKAKGISLDNSPMKGSELENLAKMPGKNEILGQVVSLMLSPGANLIALIKGPGAKVAGQIKALEKKLETA
ncbi:MAG: 50S ribosomal protein L10 [Candidatus Fibromonas sp.]|jgi:large subunit ribosomal protein L10|nr:50S ribosomal protein L10 [Candidatus Fibromonas sp.]